MAQLLMVLLAAPPAVLQEIHQLLALLMFVLWLLSNLELLVQPGWWLLLASAQLLVSIPTGSLALWACE
jgi:hypothetical protein